MRLEIGQKMFVARDEEAENYVTSLQDTTGDYLLVGVPYHRGHPLILAPGETVLVTYVSEDAAYRFSSVYRGRRMERIPLYLLQRPEKVQRIQRRRMVRVPVTLEVHGAEKPNYGAPRQYERWFTYDLSGSGVRLISGRPLDVGSQMVLEFTITGPGGTRRISAVGRVNRVAKLEDDDLGRYAVGVEFEGLAKADEDAIVAFLFHKMAAERRLR